MKAAHEAELRAGVKKMRLSCSYESFATLAARDMYVLTRKIEILSDSCGEVTVEA